MPSRHDQAGRRAFCRFLLPFLELFPPLDFPPPSHATLLAFGFASLFGVTGPALVVVIIASSVPCASNSYLLARQMGGDAKLMAEIITLQTLAATLTIPLALLLVT